MEVQHWVSETTMENAEEACGMDSCELAEALRKAAIEACGDVEGIVTKIDTNGRAVFFWARVGEAETRIVEIRG